MDSARGGRVMTDRAATDARRYHTRQVMGLCARCGQCAPETGKTKCRRCLDRMRAYRQGWVRTPEGREKENARLRRWYHSQRTKGRCMACNKPAARRPDGRHYSRCEYHAERCRQEERARRARLKGEQA